MLVRYGSAVWQPEGLTFFFFLNVDNRKGDISALHKLIVAGRDLKNMFLKNNKQIQHPKRSCLHTFHLKNNESHFLLSEVSCEVIRQSFLFLFP